MELAPSPITNTNTSKVNAEFWTCKPRMLTSRNRGSQHVDQNEPAVQTVKCHKLSISTWEKLSNTILRTFSAGGTPQPFTESPERKSEKNIYKKGQKIPHCTEKSARKAPLIQIQRSGWISSSIWSYWCCVSFQVAVVCFLESLSAAIIALAIRQSAAHVTARHLNGSVLKQAYPRWMQIRCSNNHLQGCISCGILVSGIRARGVSSEHMENMEMFSCSPT